jgi:predicted DNA-binding protein YlxM (UPF0122 family)
MKGREFMIRILDGYYWLEEEVGDNTKEIRECLEKGLIKWFDDDSQAKFIVLDSNITKVKEILKKDYDKLEEYSIIKYIHDYFCGSIQGLEIESIYGDKIYISINTIYDLIKDDEEIYLSDDKKIRIYNSNCPYDELYNILNELGREQAKIQIQDLLNSISNQKFS